MSAVATKTTILGGPVKVTLEWNHAITEQMVPGFEKGLTQAAIEVAEKARTSMGRNHGGARSLPGQPPNSQIGHLSQFVVGLSPAQYGKPMTAAAGTNVFYGRVLEFGKVITAKGGALVFPINKAGERFSRSGNEGKFTANMRGVLNALKFKYTGRRKLVWIPTKRGSTIIGVMDTGGKNAKGARFLLNEPMFLMTKRVNIRPRPWLRPAFNAVNIPFVVGAKASSEWRKAGLIR